MNPEHLIITPDRSVWWMSSHVSSAFLMAPDNSEMSDILKLIVTGRCKRGMSRLGEITLNYNRETQAISLKEISESPLIELGELGTFDHRGMSYPFFIEHKKQSFLFYSGWKLTLDTKFENNLGLLKFDKTQKKWRRISRAPIFPLDNIDPLGIGSVTLTFNDHDQLYYMFYTSFLSWKSAGNHEYTVRLARTKNLVNWEKSKKTLIQNNDELHSICRANFFSESIVVCARGSQYSLYQLKTKVSLHNLFNESISISEFQKITPKVKEKGFSEEQSYPHISNVFGKTFLLFNGSGFGKSGLCIKGL